MDRRKFLKASVAAGLAAKIVPNSLADNFPPGEAIPKRSLGKTGEQLSVIGFGGIVVMNAEQSAANRSVSESVDRDINYFDVAPSYGDAELHLGPALEPYRQKVFLACKTGKRDKEGALAELHQSLRNLRTDHFDLYQLHGLVKREDLEKALAPGGALEAFQEARQAGKIRFIGFSAHSVETALQAIERYPFDTILFPFNYVTWFQGNFGPQVLESARSKGMGCLALKAMAHTKWPESMKSEERPYPKCWYQPISEPDHASLAVRFTLSLPITAAIPPGEERLFRLAMDIAGRFTSLTDAERDDLKVRAAGVEPIFRFTG